MEDFGLYLVMTAPAAGYEECCRAAVRAGVRMVQLRMKDAPQGEVVAVAKRLMEIVRGTRTKLIVNDDPEAAALAGADGVHVGQGDMRPSEVRRRWPRLGIVGLSTHNPAQVAAAAAENPDYIGVGPVYATPTKKIPDPTLGLDVMARMIEAAPCPAVAIGGIDASNIPAVKAAGARNFAVVRAVCKAADPYRAILDLDAAWHGYRVRQARLADAESIFALVHLNRDQLVPRSMANIVENIDRFVVAQSGRDIVGCAAFQIHPEIGKPQAASVEVQSLAVRSPWRRRGIGRALVEAVCAKTAPLDAKELIVLTFAPEFFSSLGFHEIPKAGILHKLYTGCINCTKHADPFTCPEIAMIRENG